jgi:hypothetical protein
MKFRSLLFVSIWAISVSSTSYSYTDGDLWVGGVAMLCLHTDKKYENTFVGAALINDVGYKAWLNGKEQEFEKPCFKSRQWVSPELCDEAMNLDFKSSPPVTPIYNKYANEIPGLESLSKCVCTAGSSC